MSTSTGRMRPRGAPVALLVLGHGAERGRGRPRSGRGAECGRGGGNRRRPHESALPGGRTAGTRAGPAVGRGDGRDGRRAAPSIRAADAAVGAGRSVQRCPGRLSERRVVRRRRGGGAGVPGTSARTPGQVPDARVGWGGGPGACRAGAQRPVRHARTWPEPADRRDQGHPCADHRPTHGGGQPWWSSSWRWRPRPAESPTSVVWFAQHPRTADRGVDVTRGASGRHYVPTRVPFRRHCVPRP